MSECRVFKVVSGEEVICRVISDSGGVYTVTKARLIVPYQRSATDFGLELYPFLRSEPDAEFELHQNIIITSVAASAMLERAYIEQTTPIDLSASHFLAG